jgi:hypothetical protein
MAVAAVCDRRKTSTKMKTKMENSGLNKETKSPRGNRFMASWVPYKKFRLIKCHSPSSIVAF